MSRLLISLIALMAHATLGCGLLEGLSGPGHPHFSVIVRNDRAEPVWVAYDVASSVPDFVPGHYQYRASAGVTTLAFTQPGGAGATRTVTVYDGDCHELVRLEPGVSGDGSRLVHLIVGQTVEVAYDEDVPAYGELPQAPEDARCARP